MTQNGHEPRNGEKLVNWINRIRPGTAPEIDGQPAFGPNGLAWTADGWTVTAEINENGQPAAHWHVPDGVVIGYSLDADGHRTAFVNVENGDPVNVEGWPVAA